MIEKTKIKTILTSFILLSLFTYICVIFWSTPSPIRLHNNVQRTENNFIKPKSSTVTAMTTRTDYLNDGGYAYGVDVVGGFAYVADGIDGLEIISISNPYDINELDEYNDYYDGSLEAMNVVIWKDVAYVVTKFFGMWIVESLEFINLTSVENIGYLQDENEGPIFGVTRGTKNVALITLGDFIPTPPYYWSYDCLFIADGWYGVEAWTNPYSETPNERYIYHHNNNNSYDVVPTNNYIYVADGSDGLEIYDRSSTNLLGSYKDGDGGIAYDLYVQDDYAYVGEGSNGFEIIDISDPYNPIEIGDYYDGGTVEDIIVSGNYAYIADGADGLEIVDISDPYHPKKVGNYSDGGYARGLDLDGSYVYLADGSDGLEVIHVDFVVNSISITSPISSSKCQTGDNDLITWYSQGDIPNVKITLLKNGVYFQTIATSTGNDGSHIWPVSTGLTHSSQYKIKIEDATDPSVFDLSNNFEIYTNTITISSPESTSSWATGTSHHIYWDSNGYISTVDIILYEDGDYLDTIRSDVSNEGSYYWTISSDLIASSKYQIKIQESSDPNIYVLSNYFTIEVIPQETPIWKEIWFWAMIGAIAVVVLSLVLIINNIKKRGIRVFISHTVKDYAKYQIRDLAKHLESQKGISKVHYCEKDLVGNIDDWMEKTVPRSQLLIFFSTENSMKSDDCINEIILAIKHNIHIMPILGENMKWDDLEIKKGDLKIKLNRDFGKEFNSEDIGGFREELYEYIMEVKSDIENEIREKTGRNKAKKLKT